MGFDLRFMCHGARLMNHDLQSMFPSASLLIAMVGVLGVRGVKLGTLPGGLNSPAYLARMPGSATTLLVTDENAVLQIELP